jgi:hypothetical protein
MLCYQGLGRLLVPAVRAGGTALSPVAAAVLRALDVSTRG